MNFEDFLVLHLSIEKINEWQYICNLKNHFVNPLCSRDYLSLFKEKIISDYEKGSFPIKNFNMSTIKHLIKNFHFACLVVQIQCLLTILKNMQNCIQILNM